MYLLAGDLLGKSASKCAIKILASKGTLDVSKPKDGNLYGTLKIKDNVTLLWEVDHPRYDVLALEKITNGNYFPTLHSAIVDAAMMFGVVERSRNMRQFRNGVEMPEIRRIPLLTKFKIKVDGNSYTVASSNKVFKHFMKKIEAISHAVLTGNFSECGKYDREFPTKTDIFNKIHPQYKLLTPTESEERKVRNFEIIKGLISQAAQPEQLKLFAV